MISSCARCAEFERVVQWVRAADRFTERYGCPFLYLYCRTLLGSVLVATREWEHAEAELVMALRESRGSQPAVRSRAEAAAEAVRRLGEEPAER